MGSRPGDESGGVVIIGVDVTSFAPKLDLPEITQQYPAAVHLVLESSTEMPSSLSQEARRVGDDMGVAVTFELRKS